MTTANFFTDYQYQAQIEETQKKVAKLWEDSQKQLVDSQKQLASRWLEMVSAGTPLFDYAENTAKAISFQQDLINSTLNTQQVIANLAIETQKQIWDGYFQSTQKFTQTMSKAS